MGRPALKPGEWGEVYITDMPDGQVKARVKYRDAGGYIRQVQRVRPSKTAARKAVLEAVATAVAMGVGIGQKPPTIRDLVDEYLSWGRNVKSPPWRPQSADQYERVATAAIYPAFGPLLAHHATTPILEGHLQAITAPSMRRQARIILSGAFARGVRMGTVATNPVPATTPAPKKAATPRALTPADVEAVRDAVKAWQDDDQRPGPTVRGAYLLPFLDVLVATGARPNEVLGLQWPRVNLDARTVDVGPTVARIKVDGKSRLVLQDDPKTTHGRRTLTLPDWAAHSLATQALDPYGRTAGALTDPPGLVFPNARGGLMDLGNIRRTLRAVLKGTPAEGFHPYLLRSTALTAVADVYGMVAARDVAGHASVAITEAHYLQRAAAAPDVSAAVQDYRPRD